MGLPIKELPQLAEYGKTAVVIIAVAPKSQYEMYQTVEKYGFSHVLRVDEIVKNWLK
jgi:hypothetical protein